MINRPGQQKSNVRTSLFSQKNRDNLYGILLKDFQVRSNSHLDNRQTDRLERTLDHYIEEVYSVKGEQQPIQLLNREILQVTAQDFENYCRRKEIVKTAPVTAVQTVMDETLYQDTARRYEIMQQERGTGSQALPSSIPDFHVSMDDDGPTSAELYERIKRAREDEATKSQLSLNRLVSADDTFREGQIKQNRLTELILSEKVSKPKAPLNDVPLAVPPDAREIYTQNLNQLPFTDDHDGQRDKQIMQQQDFLIRQEDTINYKETEYNLFVNSGDRNWLYMNNGENRYTFSINFDPANMRQSYSASPAVNHKFRNIVRIELVKITVPLETIDVAVMRSGGAGDASDSGYNYSVLSFPYISLVIPELEANNFGTNNFIDRSFGLVHYDACWQTDSLFNLPTLIGGVKKGQLSRGYVSMIPKFLKCQRIYHPTPLATLQKLSISVLRPDGTPISTSLDVVDIRTIFGGNTFSSASSIYSVEDGGSPYYFFINTVPFFSRFAISVGDRIQIAGFTYNQDTLTANPGLVEFSNWINRPVGHAVVNIGHGNEVVGTYTADGPNTVGYANYIIIDARYMDPTTGSISLASFSGGITTLLANPDNIGALISPRRLINLNRQIQTTFRVITRQMDSVAQLRPDNA